MSGGRYKMAQANRGHIREIDLVRTLTVLGVISVHTIWFTNAANNVSANLFTDMLHYTRNVFMFMTAFVLFYVYFKKPYNLSAFWGKRFKLVGIPYLIWSAYYVYFGGGLSHGIGNYLSTLGLDVIQGTAWFHLYYLLVTMQFYLVFPLAVWLVRKTAGRHRWLLTASLVLEMGMMTLFHFAPGAFNTVPVAGWLMANRNALVFTYQFYLLLGALTAVHLDRIEAFVRENGRRVVGGLVASGLAMAGYYLLEVFVWHLPAQYSSDVFQPLMPIYSVFVIFTLYHLGQRWVRAMARLPFATWILIWGADLSFGVYLIHPAILETLTTWYLWLLGPFTRVIITPVTALVTFTLSLAVVRIIAATPLANWVIGRQQVPIPWERVWGAVERLKHRIWPRPAADAGGPGDMTEPAEPKWMEGGAS